MTRRIVTLTEDDTVITTGRIQTNGFGLKRVWLAVDTDCHELIVTVGKVDGVWTANDLDNGDGGALDAELVEAIKAAAVDAVIRAGVRSDALLQQMADDEAADYAEHAAKASAAVAAQTLARTRTLEEVAAECQAQMAALPPSVQFRPGATTRKA